VLISYKIQYIGSGSSIISSTHGVGDSVASFALLDAAACWEIIFATVPIFRVYLKNYVFTAVSMEFVLRCICYVSSGQI
jgi:hypothetical protein